MERRILMTCWSLLDLELDPDSAQLQMITLYEIHGQHPEVSLATHLAYLPG